MDEKIYTVDQVAAILDLHPKTVRRFIREGKLMAGKVGGQWRITEKELKRFSGVEQGKVATSSPRKADEEDRGSPSANTGEKVRVSAVVDIWVEDTDEAVRLTNTLMAVMNSKDPAFGQARCDHIYYKEEGRAQFLLWGQPLFISKMLKIFQKIAE